MNTHTPLRSLEGKVIQLGAIFYWLVFWLLNAIDKVANGSGFLWAGKDRIPQMSAYFSSIGFNDPFFVTGTLGAIGVVEFAAFILMAAAFWYLAFGRAALASRFFFWGTFSGMVIFSVFAMGDVVFGDREELLEHTIYWMAIIISWAAYSYFPRLARE